MNIEINKSIKFLNISNKKIIQAVELTLGYNRKNNSILSVNFVGLKKIKSLNKKYAGKDKPTDVLSFAMSEGQTITKENNDLGDIFICPLFVTGSAKKNKIPYEEEMLRVLIHGVLHLLGYDHMKKNEEKIMFAEQEKILRKLL